MEIIWHMETIWRYMETWGTHAAQLHEHDAEMSTCDCDWAYGPMSWGDAWTAGGQFFFKARPEKEAPWNRKDQKPQNCWPGVVSKKYHEISCPTWRLGKSWIPENTSRSGHLTCRDLRCAMPIPKWTRVWHCDDPTDLEAVVQGRSGRCSTREFMDEMNEHQPGSASRQPWDLPEERGSHG